MQTTDTGRLFTWGSVENNLLGYPLRDSNSAPRVVVALDNIFVQHVVASRKEVTTLTAIVGWLNPHPDRCLPSCHE